MSSIKLTADSGGGTFEIKAPSSSANTRVLTLPDTGNLTLGKTGILQVVQTVKNDTASVSNATYADISGLTATITPSSTSNKILVSFVLQYGGHNNSYVAWKAYRDSTLLPVGTQGTGNMTNASFGGFQEQSNSQYGVQTAVWQYLDSPNSTSALTYKLQWASVYQPGGSYIIYLNRPQNADNNAYKHIWSLISYSYGGNSIIIDMFSSSKINK